MPAKVTVYDLSGDEPAALQRYAVVAKEMVASDSKRYSLSLPDKPAAAAKPGKPAA